MLAAGAALLLPGAALSQSTSAGGATAALCAAALPEPGFAPSNAALAMRARSIQQGTREVDLPWRTTEEARAHALAMPDWMRKIGPEVLDRIILLQRKGVLEPGRRHWAADFSNALVQADSQARLKVECAVNEWAVFDERLFQSLGGRFILGVADPVHPITGRGFVLAWVPPERIRCLAERPDVRWIHSPAMTALSEGLEPAASRK